MAEIILSALLPFVLEKLASSALKNIVRSKEIQSQLKKLETSLPQIEALLNDAAEKEIQDKRVKDWLKSLQHVAYDIDDVLDSLATDTTHRELTQESEGGGITRKVRKLIIPTCCTTTFSSSSSSSSTTKMHEDKLSDITTKLQQLYDEKNNLGLTVKEKRSKNINRIYQTSLFDSPNIVGRGDEKDILLQKLLSDEPCDQNNFSIVPIVGMGGMGKTTLARLLYNEPKVKDHFELKAWVCVSDEFDSFNISKVIFQSITGEEKKFEDLNLLQEALRNKLAEKRFLLVLDDVWSEKIEDWNTLVPPFHAVAPGSKIIITTRKKQLLQQLGNANPYHLHKLSHEDALSLFAQHALGAPNFESYPTLRPHGEGIVQKCDGLPLAIKSLGTSLKTRTNEEDWKELLNSKIWSLKDEGGILPALRLSYHELSACLKQLFAYSSLFPKDYVFEKDDLILLWMAEGFLHKSTTEEPMEMERLGEKYFDELLSKSFFEHVNSDKSLFVMHDLMNDLATSVAGEFFVRLDIEMKNKIEEHSLEKFRHMSFVREEFMACKKFEEFERANSLRTFLAVPIVLRDSNWLGFHLSPKILVDLLPHLPLLRVLSLSNLQIDEVPESVGNLKHLRYLNLSQTPITVLPDNVCNLYNLQTLIVVGCQNLSKLPDSFLKLKNLRHFDIRDTPLLNNMPLGIGEMKSLQSLPNIIIGGENEFPISGLKNLKNLRRRVCIHGLDKLQNNDQVREVNLSQMRLRELKVEWSDVFDGSRKQIFEKEVLDVLKPHSDNLKELEIVSYGGTEFPKWVTDPSFNRLTDVLIKKCRNCKFLPPFGQLPSLKKLSIGNMDEVKEVGSELLGNGPAAFPSLEVLKFENMPQWEVWSINSGVVDAVFPFLQELVVRGCPNLVKVSLEALPSLRVLKVISCGDGVFKSLVGVASSVTQLIIKGISGLSDEVWGGVVQLLGSIEELKIRSCNEIRNLWKSEEACKVLVNLNKLYIWDCEKLVRIGGGEKDEEEEEGSNLLFLTSLRMLQIWDCKNLKHLSCPNSIEVLKIRGCNNLEYLSCPNSIKELQINDCKNLEHLSCPDSIVELKISYCGLLTSVFFPTIGGRGGGGWQRLKSLEIKRCSKELEKEVEKQVLIVNNMPPKLDSLYIIESKYLKSITKYTSSFIQQLTRLVIEDCTMIIESFPDFQNLTSLKDLVIRNCPGMDGPPLRRSGGGGCVNGVWPPKLHSLRIGKLKRPISEWGPLPTSSSLVQLYLLGGFGSSSSSWAEEEEDVKSFPTSSLLISSSSSSSLTTLVLMDFEKMERISSSEGLQHLQHLLIWDCPRLKHLPETLLPSLLSLRIYGALNEELKEKMTSRRGSYWPLLSHIPQVDIR